jgi:hypothetical protein
VNPDPRTAARVDRYLAASRQLFARRNVVDDAVEAEFVEVFSSLVETAFRPLAGHAALVLTYSRNAVAEKLRAGGTSIVVYDRYLDRIFDQFDSLIERSDAPGVMTFATSLYAQRAMVQSCQRDALVAIRRHQFWQTVAIESPATTNAWDELEHTWRLMSAFWQLEPLSSLPRPPRPNWTGPGVGCGLQAWFVLAHELSHILFAEPGQQARYASLRSAVIGTAGDLDQRNANVSVTELESAFERDQRQAIATLWNLPQDDARLRGFVASSGPGPTSFRDIMTRRPHVVEECCCDLNAVLAMAGLARRAGSQDYTTIGLSAISAIHHLALIADMDMRVRDCQSAQAHDDVTSSVYLEETVLRKSVLRQGVRDVFELIMDESVAANFAEAAREYSITHGRRVGDLALFCLPPDLAWASRHLRVTSTPHQRWVATLADLGW